MIVQWYSTSQEYKAYAGIFDGHHRLAKLDCDNKKITDEILRKLGLRRREKWQSTCWGAEAKLQKL